MCKELWSYSQIIKYFKKCINFGIFINYKYDNTNQKRTIVALNSNNRLFDNIYKTTRSFCVEGTELKKPQLSFDTEPRFNITSHETDFKQKISEEGIFEILEDENKIKRCNSQQISQQNEIFTVGNKNGFNVYMPMYKPKTTMEKKLFKQKMLDRDKIKIEIDEERFKLLEASESLKQLNTAPKTLDSAKKISSAIANEKLAKINIEIKERKLTKINVEIWNLRENKLFKGFKEQKYMLVNYKNLIKPKICLKNNDNEDVEFYLKGIIVKSGSRKGGHYWGYLKASEKEGDWYEVNDTRTFKLTRSKKKSDINNLSKILKKIQNHNIYLLIFKRVTGIVVPYKPTGLPNQANYCWFNTVNQMLFSDSDIKNYEEIFYELNKDDYIFNKLIQELDLDNKLPEAKFNKLKYKSSK